MEPSNKPPITFFLHEHGISVYPPTGGHRTLFRPKDPRELERVLRHLLRNEDLNPEELNSRVQQLVEYAAERWPMTTEPLQERQAEPRFDSSQIPERVHPDAKPPAKAKDL
jgi:hypothetical protein